MVIHSIVLVYVEEQESMMNVVFVMDMVLTGIMVFVTVLVAKLMNAVYVEEVESQQVG
jgi:hypothetical protein